MKDVDSEMYKLIQIGKDAYTIGPRSRIGNNIVDFFTFVQRLETKGKYDTNFFEFIKNIEEFKKKKFIQTMLNYYTNIKNKNGGYLWTELDYPSETPTVFEVVGTTPISDPFGTIIGYSTTAKRSESQKIGI